MRTEYLDIQTAIELFEEYRIETINTLLLKYNGIDFISPKLDGHCISIRIMDFFTSRVTNLLFYVTGDLLPFGEEEIKGIPLYGKPVGNPNILESLYGRNIMTPDMTMNFTFNNIIENYYILEHSYDYTERYRSDYNYAVLVKASSREITHREICVKYDEFLNLMQQIDKDIKAQRDPLRCR